MGKIIIYFHLAIYNFIITFKSSIAILLFYIKINECVVLEDDIEYGIAEKLIINNIQYICLVNMRDIEDYCIRKFAVIDNKEMIIGLDNEAEFDFALLHFTKKHQEEN